MAYIWKGFFQILGFAGLMGIFLANAPSSSFSQENVSNHAVVELFTSQGCSSCPPADEFLGQLAKRKNVTALTLPVDYWDYLGWKDTLASRQFTNRQRTYARLRGDANVYTPQMVINGVTHKVGSRYSRVNSAIQTAQSEFKKHAVPMSLKLQDNTIWVGAGDAAEGSTLKDGTVWIACVKKAVTVNIGRGENHGRKITYYNVVRQLAPVGQWMGKAVNLRLPKQPFINDKPDFFVALLQAKDNGRIIGVAQVSN
ncbi:MAG: DUF1223 domain-containing protein [Methyloligellaceae bacterium]